jgi:hypothetical protein
MAGDLEKSTHFEISNNRQSVMGSRFGDQPENSRVADARNTPKEAKIVFNRFDVR